jgi:PilZ domain
VDWPGMGGLKKMSPSQNDRRVWTRFAANRKTVNLSETDTEEISWMARVQDVSRSGLGLLFKRSFEIGAKLTVEFLVAGKEQPLQLQVQVVHAEQNSKGEWQVGCAFLEELSEQDLAGLLKSPA